MWPCIRLKAPYEPRPGGFEAHFHAGSLEFPAEEVQRLQALFSTVPTVVDLYLDRPAIVPEIAAGAAALLVNYGSSTRAFTDVIFGHTSPKGRLPFDLPSSTRAVEESRGRHAVRHRRTPVPLRRRNQLPYLGRAVAIAIRHPRPAPATAQTAIAIPRKSTCR